MALDDKVDDGNPKPELRLKGITLFNICKALPTPGMVRELKAMDRIAKISSEAEFMAYLIEHPEDIFESYSGPWLSADDKKLLFQELERDGIVVNDTGVYVNGKQIYSSSPAAEAERQRRLEQEDLDYLNRERFRQHHQARQKSGKPL